MQKYYKIVELGYLIIAVIFVIETVLKWNSNREKAYLFLVFAILAVVMYFFKKRFRKKLTKGDKS
jgi:membrane protein implicated in regulation of membrane protease activity